MPNLYAYQQTVYDLVFNERCNVILQAPTGTGKTWAALVPYFANLDRYAEQPFPADAPLPLTCRYAVPMRVLATQFEREYHEKFAALDRRGARLLARYRDALGVNAPAIQTGESPDDREFASPLTFCTIDQLLASFIGTPYSLSPRFANLNVGAVVGSYLIFDEFHLYPLDSGGGARLTTLAMLKQLAGLAPFILMTATYSSTLLNDLAQLLDATVVRVSDEELPGIMRGRSRNIQRGDELTADAVLAAHAAAKQRGAGASLVVCNTVSRAQALYLQLRNELERRGTRDEVILELLHSRFTQADRKCKGALLEACLGENQWEDGHFLGRDTIIVATQVVEVGLNISAGVLHTELAPASSVIQRAGRCARFPQQQGEVIVYPIPANAKGSVSYLPYDKNLCEATWEQLGALDAGPSGAPFGFAEEQGLIDTVHTEEDKGFISRFKRDEQRLQRSVMESLTTHDRATSPSLIRNVISVSVLVHPTPDKAITTGPFTWESFQLHPGSLEGAWEALQARADDLPLEWTMRRLEAGGDVRQEDDNDREQPYTWSKVTDKAQIRGALRLALPPQLAAYDRELGFRLLLTDEPVAHTYQSQPIARRKQDFSDRSLREQRSYVEHIRGLMRAYDWSVRSELAWIAAQFERALGVRAESLDLALRLAIACHDIGKLTIPWQRWAHATQDELIAWAGADGALYRVKPGREFLAKTDELPNWGDNHAVQTRVKPKKPNHACAGVVSSLALIGQQTLTHTHTNNCDQREAAKALTRAAVSAIARHHTPTAVEYGAVEYAPAAREALAQAFAVCRLPTDVSTLDLQAHPAGELPGEWLVTPSDDSEMARLTTWLGFTLVRALRLCDQRAERKL